MGLSEITGIKLKGANFEIETSLQLLHSNKEPALGLVYGKNGAGKSTISRAFSKLAGKQEDTIETAFAINGKAEDIILTDEDRSNIHVFNEQYVDNNIKFRPDDKGLETIVVLGRANDIERDMDMAQKAVDEQKQKVEKQKELCDLYEDEKSEKSPHYHIKKVRDALKGEGAWGGRDAKIQGHIRATSTREDTYKNFISRKPQKKRDELIAEFDNKLKELNEAKSGIKQLEGFLSAEINQIKQDILDVLVNIEVTIDYPEYDTPEVQENELKNMLNKVENKLEKLEKSFDNGKIIKDGIKTAIIGKPNAGKSSLLNAILKEDRAIVTDIAGTTRDTIEEYVTINGIALKLIDTAGIREAKDSVEKIGELIAFIKKKRPDVFSHI